jgi:hypothetical protein
VRRSLARLAVLPVACLGLAAAAAVAAPAALAQTDTGGTVTVTVPYSYIVQLAKAGVVEVPLPPASLSSSTSNQTVTATFPVTGGDGDVSVFNGSLDLGGTLDLVSIKGHLVTLSNLQFNLSSGTISATPGGSSTPVTLYDIAGSVTIGPGATSQTYSSTALDVDPAGASYLDSALGTSAFTAGQDVGTFDAAWTLSS